MIETLGDGTYTLGDLGIKIKVKDNVVVTVLTADSKEEFLESNAQRCY